MRRVTLICGNRGALHADCETAERGPCDEREHPRRVRFRTPQQALRRDSIAATAAVTHSFNGPGQRVAIAIPAANDAAIHSAGSFMAVSRLSA